MRLRRLCKSGNSRIEGDCPAVYVVDDDPAMMVAQGRLLEGPSAVDLRELAADERGVSLPAETVLRAAALMLAEAGRPGMLEEVASFLASRTDRAG